MFIRNFKFTLLIIFTYIFFSCLPLATLATSSPGPTLSRNLKVAVKITNQGNQSVRAIRVQLPLISADSPYQQTMQETFNYPVEEIVISSGGNRTAHILFDSIAPGSNKTILINYLLKIMPTGRLDSSNPTNLGDFLNPAVKIQSDHPEIISQAINLNGNEYSEQQKIKNISRFVNSHMTFNANAAHKNQGALAALQNREGVCEDFAALFIALCRASDIPARQVNGYADPKLTGESWDVGTEGVSLQGYRHAWVEVYLRDRGWVAIDPTFKIYPRSTETVTELGPAYIAQNYQDQPIRISYQGEGLTASWYNLLIVNKEAAK